MPKRPTLSASQIATVRECPAKWAFDKLDGIPRTEAPSAALGTLIHTLIERWYDAGEVPDAEAHPVAAPVALAILAHLPVRGAEGFSIETEHEIHFYWAEADVFVKGFIDLLVRLPDGTVLVFDHKSTSSIAKYAKDEADLLTDAQALFYGCAVRLEEHERTGHLRDVVELQWTYGETKTLKTKLPQSKPVRLKQTLPILEEGLKTLLPAAQLIRDLYETKTSGKEIEGDPKTCFKYGPCPYRDQCPTYERHHRSEKEPKYKESPVAVDLELLARLSALSNGAGAATAPAAEPTPVAAPAPAQTVTPEPIMTSIPTPEVLVPSSVLPPDAAPNVTPENPPPPPVKEPKKRGRGPNKAKPKVAAEPVRVDGDHAVHLAAAFGAPEPAPVDPLNGDPETGDLGVVIPELELKLELQPSSCSPGHANPNLLVVDVGTITSGTELALVRTLLRGLVIEATNADRLVDAQACLTALSCLSEVHE